MTHSRRQQSARLLAATALPTLAALIAGGWPDARPVHIRPVPAPGTSPAPLETTR